MTLSYPTKYKDDRGAIDTIIVTDGKSIKMTLRGIDFNGIHFWELYPETTISSDLPKGFSFSEEGFLINYSMKINMPVLVVTDQNNEIEATIDFEMGNGKILITIEGKTYFLGRPNFEYGLNPTNTIIPNIKYIKCCTNCAHSEYSPFGSDTYGDLMCFKKSKQVWKTIGNLGLKDIDNWEKLIIERTQEAFLCEEFEKRDFNAPGYNHRYVL